MKKLIIIGIINIITISISTLIIIWWLNERNSSGLAEMLSMKPVFIFLVLSVICLIAVIIRIYNSYKK